MTGSCCAPRRKQRGVAVITALLLTTLAITIVASLFWQQQVQVRSIENQRLQLQKQWVLRGALDWARLILREDRRISGAADHLGEPWAVPLAPTRLDQYVENDQIDGDMGDAQLAGSIVDAQSRFNLRNLASDGGGVNTDELKAFRKLLENLELDPKMATVVADLIATTQDPEALFDDKTVAKDGTRINPEGEQPETPNPAVVTAPKAKVMPLMQVDDLLTIPEMKPEHIDRLRDFVIVLPKNQTKVNANTASAEVLSAVIEDLTLGEAKAVIAARERTYFRMEGDLQLTQPPLPAQRVGIMSDYFLVNGKVQLGRGYLEMVALIEREGTNPRNANGSGATQIVWVKEN